MNKLFDIFLFFTFGMLLLCGCENSTTKSKRKKIDERYSAVVSKVSDCWYEAMFMTGFTKEQTDSSAIEILAGKFLDYGGEWKGYNKDSSHYYYSTLYPFFACREESLNFIDWAMLVRHSIYNPQDFSLSDNWRVSDRFEQPFLMNYEQFVCIAAAYPQVDFLKNEALGLITALYGDEILNPNSKESNNDIDDNDEEENNCLPKDGSGWVVCDRNLDFVYDDISKKSNCIYISPTPEEDKWRVEIIANGKEAALDSLHNILRKNGKPWLISLYYEYAADRFGDKSYYSKAADAVLEETPDQYMSEIARYRLLRKGIAHGDSMSLKKILSFQPDTTLKSKRQPKYRLTEHEGKLYNEYEAIYMNE